MHIYHLSLFLFCLILLVPLAGYQHSPPSGFIISSANSITLPSSCLTASFRPLSLLSRFHFFFQMHTHIHSLTGTCTYTLSHILTYTTHLNTCKFKSIFEYVSSFNINGLYSHLFFYDYHNFVLYNSKIPLCV